MRAPGQVVPGHSRGCSTGDTGTDGGWRTSHLGQRRGARALQRRRGNTMACIGRATADRQQAADTSAHQHATGAQPDSSTISVGSAWIGERRSVAIVVCSVACDQSSIGAVTRIRWSPPGRPGGVWSRSARTARKRRFIRFLTTALPTERGIANAKRGCSVVSGRTTSRIGPRPRRVPSARSRANAR